MRAGIKSWLLAAPLAAPLAVGAWLGSVMPLAAAEPQPWQLGFQAAVTPLMERITVFNNWLMAIATLISLFVLALMIYIVFRFRARPGVAPSKVSHNTRLEIIWTLIPALILIGIAVPSFRLLYYQETIPKFDLTIKATGHQWYWSYEYPDEGVAFDALMLTDAELSPGQPRLLATDAPVTVPVGATVRVLLGAADVLHSWAMPAFGVKVDAVPGRINQTWFQATKTGIYYGQCSELCGARHSFMPIEIHVVEAAAYRTWLARMKAQAATTPTTLAAR